MTMDVLVPTGIRALNTANICLGQWNSHHGAVESR